MDQSSECSPPPAPLGGQKLMLTLAILSGGHYKEKSMLSLFFLQYSNFSRKYHCQLCIEQYKLWYSFIVQRTGGRKCDHKVVRSHLTLPQVNSTSGQ